MPDQYRPFSKQCKLCGQHFHHDGQLLWAELRRKIFDDQDCHVVGFEAQPLQGGAAWCEESVVCVHCLKNLGILAEQPSSSPP